MLLLEAGSDNGDISYRVPADRFKTFQEATMNWGYKTVPQNHLKGQQIDYSRGKGLGGSTAINFSCCKSRFLHPLFRTSRILRAVDPLMG